MSYASAVALQPVAGSIWARDAAAAVASLVGGVFLVKFFDFLQYSGALDKVSPLTTT